MLPESLFKFGDIPGDFTSSERFWALIAVLPQSLRYTRRLLQCSQILPDAPKGLCNAPRYTGHLSHGHPDAQGVSYSALTVIQNIDSTPEAFHGMVLIKRQKEAKMVVRVKSIHRAAHAMLLDESVKDHECAEYAVNNFVDGYHYWSIY